MSAPVTSNGQSNDSTTSDSCKCFKTCNKRSCPKNHHPDRQKVIDALDAARDDKLAKMASSPCRFGADCSKHPDKLKDPSKPVCPFWHPPLQSKKPILCKFGPECRFRAKGTCTFSHSWADQMDDADR